MERVSIELEVIAMDGYNLLGVIDDPSRKKQNFVMRVGLMSWVVPETDVGSTKQMCSYWVNVHNTNFS